MKRKHTGKIILLLLLMFASSYGQYVEELLNADMDFDSAGSYAFWISLVNVCLITVAMMIVPFIAKIVKGTKLPYVGGKKLCLWNSVVMFIISILLMAIFDSGFVGGVGALIYYFINKWVFVSDSDTLETQNVEPTPPTKRAVYAEIKQNTQTSCKQTQSNNNQSLTKYRVFIVVSILIIITCVAVVFVLGGKDSTDGNNRETSYITYDSYYVGIRSITVSNEAAADRIYKEWKRGDASEESMIELMDYYGAEQGGGQLYVVEPGMWIDEVDEWCFDRARQIGDVAIIENDYGYTICYFSSVIER